MLRRQLGSAHLVVVKIRARRGAYEEQIVPSAMVVWIVIFWLHGQLKLLAFNGQDQSTTLQIKLLG